jgi:hypothetical protein
VQNLDGQHVWGQGIIIRALTHNSVGALARLAANVVAAAFVLTGRALVQLRVRRAPEGWRRTVGILLRSEPTRFALSAFGLRVPSLPGSIEDRIARGLGEFLAHEPDAHFVLDWRQSVTLRRRTSFVDVVALQFAADGTLQDLNPWLSAAGPVAPSPSIQDRVHAAIIDAYNRTSRLPERERTNHLRDEVCSNVSTEDRGYALRILAAACLSFEPGDTGRPVLRFSPPSFRDRRTLGFGYLSWVARPVAADGTVDLWVSAHHVGLDGVPLQECLGRLTGAWGTATLITFPVPGTPPFGPHACHAPGERPVDHLTMFVDLSPVLSLRRDVAQRFRSQTDGDVTLGTLLAWLLTAEKEFAGVRIASTVDVAASHGYERDVDVVSLRPDDYRTGPGPWDGFAEFSREFNRLIAACRGRMSPVRVGMQTAGLLPAWVHATLVRSAPSSLDDTFGTLCITIIRDACVFVAPMTDLGLRHGFFAFGSATLPSADGKVVTSVSVKGDVGRIAHYPAVLQRVIARATVLHAGMERPEYAPL